MVVPYAWINVTELTIASINDDMLSKQACISSESKSHI